MRSLTHNTFGCVSLLLALAPAAWPQTHVQSAARQLPDLAWTRDYAIPYTTAKQPPVQAKVRQQLNLSPQFLPALRAAFPQRQWFWKDHGRFGTVAEVAQTFLGVPGRSWDTGASAWIDEDRYVTEEGCVPHACTDRGMLWMDTAPAPALIFIASDVVPTGTFGDTHLWIYVSNAKLANTLPTAFQRSVRRWYDDNQAQGYKQKVILATMVSPDGGMRDVGFEDVVGKATAAGATR